MAPDPASPFHIRVAATSDDLAWARPRSAVWPDCPAERHAVEREIYLRSPGIVVLAVDANDRPFGFAEVSIRRDHVTGASAASGRALLNFVATRVSERGFPVLANDVE